MKKTVIFDFDGTIADSFPAVVAIFHELTHRSQLVTPEEIVKLRRMRLLDVARAEHIPKWRFPFLMMRGRQQMARRLRDVPVFGGVDEVIKTLRTDGCQLFIMSSNTTGNVRKFLRQYGLEQYFVKIYGGVGLFGKARALKKILQKNDLSLDKTFYVGDEPRDIEGAHAAGISCIAVSWGFNAAELLKEHEPLAVVDTPEKLLATIAES